MVPYAVRLAHKEAYMKFVCEDSFWDLFPDASIGVVVADGILPTDQVSDILESSGKLICFCRRRLA